MMDLENGAVFVQTNDAGANMVEAFARDAEGTLSHVGSFPTGGRGNGTPHLPSQGSVVFDSAGRLFVVNAGSDDVTVFDVRGSGLHLVDVTPSGGTSPVSVAAHSDLVYVLNRGGEGPGGVTGFRMTATGLRAIDGASAPLSSDEADGAQIAFSPAGHLLVVTERGTDRISTYAVRPAGTVDGPYAHASSGATPYGFDFAAGVLVVTEAFGGAVGAAAASSYALDRDHGIEPVSASVQNTRSEVCWAAVTQDGRYAYVTNFGDNTISSYEIGADGSIELLEAVAAATRQGEKGIRDEALSADGRFLYAIDADSGEIYGWSVAKDGQLSPIGAVNGLPLTVAGLAAA